MNKFPLKNGRPAEKINVFKNKMLTGKIIKNNRIKKNITSSQQSRQPQPLHYSELGQDYHQSFLHKVTKMNFTWEERKALAQDSLKITFIPSDK